MRVGLLDAKIMFKITCPRQARFVENESTGPTYFTAVCHCKSCPDTWKHFSVLIGVCAFLDFVHRAPKISEAHF
jgi:hypothetical protein